MNNQQPADSYKEAVGGYYAIHSGLEVTPQPTKHFDQTQTQAYPVHVYSAHENPAKEPTICGVRRPTFFLSLALVIVILAAAVGGGVAGSVAVENARSSCLDSSRSLGNCGAPVSVTKTVTMTSTATSPPADNTPAPSTDTVTSFAEPLEVPTGVVKLACPGMTNDVAIRLNEKSWLFTPSCGTDYSGSDFGAVIVYSFDDCLKACAAHNHFSREDECTAVTFRANQTRVIGTDHGNCFLKKGTPKGNRSVDDVDLVCGALLKLTY